MESFEKYIEGLQALDEPPPQINLRRDTGKAGLGDDIDLPILMRRPATTSAFKTYELKGISKKPKGKFLWKKSPWTSKIK